MNRKRGNKMAQSKYEVGDVIKNEKKSILAGVLSGRFCAWERTFD